jgi:hypothetical protein
MGSDPDGNGNDDGNGNHNGNLRLPAGGHGQVGCGLRAKLETHQETGAAKHRH